MQEKEKPRQWFHYGLWVYDVRAALEITKAREATSDIDVREWAESLSLLKSREEYLACGVITRLKIDENYARTIADVGEPVIIADVSFKGDEPEYALIDGQHRLRRAAIEGMEKIPAHILNREETLSIRSLAYAR